MLLAIKYGQIEVVKYIFDKTNYDPNQVNYNLLQEIDDMNASTEIRKIVTDKIAQ